jgi:hypothetical protein
LVEICFDTSALNALCDDHDSNVLIAKIRSSHRVLLSSLNIVEVVANSDEERRRSLLACLRSLSDGTLPLAMPNKLVRRATRAFAKGKMTLTATIKQEEAPTWWFLNDSTLAGSQEQQEALLWKKNLEDEFLAAHRSARDEFQELLAQAPASRPRSPGQFIKSFRTNSDALYTVVSDIFKKETRQRLSRDAMWQLFKRAPQWPLFLAGWGHEIFARALQASNYGPRGKPGTADLWFAVYLPVCDIFVTNDNGQHRALRLLNVFSRRLSNRPAPKTRVLKYHRFRRILLS